MALRFADAESWQAWQASRRRLHVWKDRLLRRNHKPEQTMLTHWVRGERPTLLVACDSDSPTNHHALLAPLAITSRPAVVAQPAGCSLDLPGDGWRPVPNIDGLLDDVQGVSTIGDHLAVGAWAHDLARERGWAQWVVQHGLLTPFSPPPPKGATVLTWSEADGAFLAENRPDLTVMTVGSPLLEAAARRPAPHVSRFERPVFLGQLHGAELSRVGMTRSATAFWRQTGATYRPHPRENDKLSRAQHAIWRRMGMEISTKGAVTDLHRPVVAAFSTGVLEAAARGLPAWVFHVDPPAWLEEFWDRYGMSRWGGPPTQFRPASRDAVARIAEVWATAH